MADRMGLLLVVEGISDYKNAVVSVTKLNDEVAQSLGEVEKESGKTEKGIQGLTFAMVKSHVAVQALSTAFNAVTSFAKKFIVGSTLLASRVDVLGTVLETVGRNAGYTSDELARYEQAVKDSGITTQAARQALIQMAQAEIDFAHSADLARLAQDAAVIANIDSSQAFERLTTGIQRGNLLMLRTMNIIVDFQGSYKQLADELGKTTKELTSQEKVQARVNAVMKAGEAISGTYEAAMGLAGKQMTSIPRYLEEIQLAIGRAFQPAFTQIIFEFKDLLAEIQAWLDANEKELREFGTAVGDLTVAMLGLKGEIPFEELTEFLESATTLIRMLTIGITTVKEFRQEHEKLGHALKIISAIVFPWPRAAEGLRTFMAEMNKLRHTYDEVIELEEKEIRIRQELAGITDQFDQEMRDLKRTTRELARAEEELVAIELELGEEREKAIEQLVKLRLQMQREYADQLIEQERETLRREIELAREREDIAKKEAEAIADAYTDAEKNRLELAQDASEEREDLVRDAARAWADFERDAAGEREEIDLDYARRRVDIERDTRRKLQDIQREFEMSLQDAARTRDAFALVQAQRRAAKEREGALTSRDRQLEDARTAKERERVDLEKSLAQERADLQRSLAEREADLERSLVKRQQAIEMQLQEALASAVEQREEDLANLALRNQREQEMQALQAQWELEDRRRRLAQQLEDMEVQYGELYGITAEGLQQQMEEWAEAYGPDGAASRIVRNFADMVEEETGRMRQGMVDTANQWAETMRKFSEVSIGLPMLPPELTFQSPKLGLQVGLERLAEFMRSTPIVSRGMPDVTGAGRSFSKSESFSRTEARHDVNVNMPDMDAVLGRQLLGAIRGALQGVA